MVQNTGSKDVVHNSACFGRAALPTLAPVLLVGPQQTLRMGAWIMDKRNSAGLISLGTTTACHVDEQENNESCWVMRLF